MPRGARTKSSWGMYHVMLRGNNKQIIFKEEEDYVRFLSLLKRFKAESDIQIYSYCLMNNHIHLLIKENSIELYKVIKQLACSYVSWFNKKYERVGHLFQDRFKSKVVENESYFWIVLTYIHMNPVKDKISDNFQGYRWSSFNDYLFNKGITDTSLVLNDLGNTREKSVSKFIELHNSALDSSSYLECEDDVTDELLTREIQLRYGINIKDLNLYSEKETAKVLKWLLLIPKVNKSRLSRMTGLTIHRIKRIIEKGSNT